MEDTDSKERGQEGQNRAPELEHTILMSGKPLHRFVQKEPRSLGIVIVLFGCAELMMGFNLLGEDLMNSDNIYVPFWLGAEFLLCGYLSIFTGAKPSKKMVTVCLAMYIVCILAIILSAAYRIDCMTHLFHLAYLDGPYEDNFWTHNHVRQLFGIESILFLSSLFVSGMLIFLSNVARLSLKSTHTQVILQVQAPPSQPST